MDENLKHILAEFEQLKGQFVITQSHKIERLIAIGTDETDYYYVTYNGRNRVWNTCVGKVIALKGYLKDEDYNEFIRLAKLNHFDQEKLWNNNPDAIIDDTANPPVTVREFAQKHRAEIENVKSPDRYLTEVCWDLN